MQTLSGIDEFAAAMKEITGGENAWVDIISKMIIQLDKLFKYLIN